MMTLWKWATRNRLLCSWKSAGGTAISTPVMPPMTNVTMNPIDHRTGTGEANAPAVHREQPVEDLDAGRHRDDHGHHAEEAVDVGAGSHGEEVVQPDQER